MVALIFFMVNINLTKKQEDYINTIYELQDTFGIAKIIDLVKILKYSPGGINDELKRLERKGIIERYRYSGFKLTEKGLEIAKITKRKHRISESFLYVFLNVPWEKCHILSNELEHTIEGELEKYILNKIENLSVCPHGNSIDLNEGKNEIKLLDAYENNYYIVKRISYEEFNILLLLKNYGIIPSKKIYIKFKYENGLIITTEKGEFPLEGILPYAVKLYEK